MFKTLIRRFAESRNERQRQTLEGELPETLRRESERLNSRLSKCPPRILVVKQDVNEDLYCCQPDAVIVELISSTLLRTGPVSLFSDLDADFRIVTTVDDPECQVWQERATHLKWDTLEFFSSYRDKVPGRDYGQSRWAVKPEEIDFSQYDIVISMDVCVPERITRQFANVLWCYYVREIKAPSYQSSLTAPAKGQDVVLNHHFRLQPPELPKHVIEFPYHIHRSGCFHRLFGVEEPAWSERSGIFVDHHTMVELSADQRKALSRFGEVRSTLHDGDREIIPTSEQIARRTMDADLREHLLNSRYFLITPGQRVIFGTAMVEAIAAGCLVVGSPASLNRHSFFITDATAATNSEDAIERMNMFESDFNLADRERNRQQRLLEYLCFVRPLSHLLDAWQRKISISRTR